jgi:hypothetical protein
MSRIRTTIILNEIRKLENRLLDSIINNITRSYSKFVYWFWRFLTTIILNEIRKKEKKLLSPKINKITSSYSKFF